MEKAGGGEIVDGSLDRGLFEAVSNLVRQLLQGEAAWMLIEQVGEDGPLRRPVCE